MSRILAKRFNPGGENQGDNITLKQPRILAKRFNPGGMRKKMFAHPLTPRIITLSLDERGKLKLTEKDEP